MLRTLYSLAVFTAAVALSVKPEPAEIVVPPLEAPKQNMMSADPEGLRAVEVTEVPLAVVPVPITPSVGDALPPVEVMQVIAAKNGEPTLTVTVVVVGECVIKAE